MNFNIIGAGRLGKNLGLALSINQIATLNSICNTNWASASNACNEIGFGNATPNLSNLPKVDITWITCKDDFISDVVSTLSTQKILKPGSLVFHCSGVYSSSILEPLKKQGCYIASLHPLKAFRSDCIDANAFKHVNCVMEGDSEACTWLKGTFEQLGASVIAIQSEAKAIYHAAATIASNYLVTLASYSEELLLKAGIDQQHSRNMICDLMQSNIINLSQHGRIAEVLTGPLSRGDTKTVSLHLQAIKDHEVNKLYKTLALATLTLTNLSDETKELFRKILEE